ncbi:MAG: FHA domain-containing protein [Candidatus Krumholzibacteria bacterium]|nr:FHA domain-containing protein [Candidatus Krumholzibacteria bacterium]
MTRLQIPYCGVLLNPSDFDPDRFDELVGGWCRDLSAGPVVVEVFNEHAQYLLFIREGQPYWGCVSGAEGFTGLSMRDLFTQLRKTQFPQVIAYSVDLLLFHALIVYLQTRPELKVSSTLVDLDEVLDRIESDRSSALVTASRPGALVMLRYKDGNPSACWHGACEKGREAGLREEFLVKIYTMSVRSPFEVRIYTDLVVTHSEDARTLPAGWDGPVSSLFLSQPPRLVVRLKNRPLKTYAFTGRQITIGRLPENDIVIDNLAVSRQHAVITTTKSGYVVRDLGSRNGTFLGGAQISEAPLKNGDVIVIGKYEISFQVPAVEEGPALTLDQTMIVPGGLAQVERRRTPPGPPRLYRRSDHEEFVIERDRVVIGRGRGADVRLTGLLAPRVTIEIRHEGDDWIMQKTGGRRTVMVNGERLDEKVLDGEDLIAVGADEFVFKR